ncbi:MULTISPECIES: TadE family protein [Kytococcus]|uniref:TadE family protein n=1 Tax=Kytococcus TaxID=57499 RepID=UPI0008A44E4A|nr:MULTISPECIES: TadE family protein [Kytococcus]OFS14805.1 hypothetical protein HMPREF3099_03360 [Kytococcus sp. HMSC28H12]
MSRWRAGERGSATTEFVLTSGLALLTVMAVLQLAFALHVKNSLTAFAVEGARHGARAGAAPGDGVARTHYLADQALVGRAVSEVSEHHEVVGGRQVVVVDVRADLPLVGPWGIGQDLEVRGRALREGT